MVIKVIVLFQQIKMFVCQNVELGDWCFGDCILFEFDFVVQFGVVCMMVNCVLCELIEEGVLKCIVGVGIFVVEVKLQLNLLMIVYICDEICVCGYEYCCCVLSWLSEFVLFDVVVVFGLLVNMLVFYVVCVYEENGCLIQFEDCYVNLVVVFGFIDQDFEVELLFEYLYNNVLYYELEIEYVVDVLLFIGEQVWLFDMCVDELCFMFMWCMWMDGLFVMFVYFLYLGNCYWFGLCFKLGVGCYLI